MNFLNIHTVPRWKLHIKSILLHFLCCEKYQSQLFMGARMPPSHPISNVPGHFFSSCFFLFFISRQRILFERNVSKIHKIQKRNRHRTVCQATFISENFPTPKRVKKIWIKVIFDICRKLISVSQNCHSLLLQIYCFYFYLIFES
jgi:hypothetical protein